MHLSYCIYLLFHRIYVYFWKPSWKLSYWCLYFFLLSILVAKLWNLSASCFFISCRLLNSIWYMLLMNIHWVCIMMRNIFGSWLSTAILSLKNCGYLSSDRTYDSPVKLWNYIGCAVCYMISYFNFDLCYLSLQICHLLSYFQLWFLFPNIMQ